MMGITHLNTPTISEDDLKAMILLKDNTCVIKVICTLDSIDSIKSLKRSPQHIFVEVRVPGSGFPSSGVQFPCSEFRVENLIPRLRTFIYIVQKPTFQFEIVFQVVGPLSFGLNNYNDV
ncbi:hypothetical protein Avbf_02473 [Armadillidium vulgare]|nr:hypothetical protein Avbf_02473 [Armadillidium vulgare]